MIRTLAFYGALAFAAASGAAFAGPLVSPPTSLAARNPIATPTAAGWSCQGRRCTDRKAQGQGGWSDCFTAWSPTHGGWLPAQYCH